MSSTYRVASIFLIRLAGVPFEAIDGLATPKSNRLARTLAEYKRESAHAKNALDIAYRAGERLVSTKAAHALRTALRTNRAPTAVLGDESAAVTRFAVAAAKVEAAERDLAIELEHEVNNARDALIKWARRVLPRYLIFASPVVCDSLLRDLHAYPAEGSELPPRRNTSRKTEQSLLLYLQRIAAKNDTFSEFGPGGWGNIVSAGRGVSLRAEPVACQRDVFFERWVAQALVRVINDDPEANLELPLRRNPNGRLEGDAFVNFNTGERIDLTPDQLTIVQRYTSGRSTESQSDPVIAQLVAKDVIRRGLEVPALEAHAVTTLIEDVSQWRQSEVRNRWLQRLQALEDVRLRFGRTCDPDERRHILDHATSELDLLGASKKSAQRFLYSANNPIGEECFRECRFELAESLSHEVATEAAPWIDLWRDSYAFIASRVAGGLQRVFDRAAAGQPAMPMPAFLRACEEARLPLTGPGLVALAVMAFQEVKAALRERLASHADKEEYELTPGDCHIVRQKFEYPKFDEYTYPSADLQLSAESIDAVAAGSYEWIVSELHPPVALLHHGVYWSCPDKPRLNEAFAQSAGGKPNFHFGFFAADFTAHTAVRLFDALPDFSYFVAPQRAHPTWKTVQPADAEVFVDDSTGDVCLRERGTGKHLGSFARNWVIPLGFHPFQFGLGRHTPRLRCGRAIVQRQSWTVTRDDLPGEFSGISAGLVMAIDRLRTERILPRYVYIRPTEQALRRSGAEGRDKDTKPVFIDLESYLFQEIFYRWLIKAGELEVTEMLPDPDHLLWQEIDGRRTFELRTLIVPRS
ncbi:MAG: hypothetical protein ACJ8M1_09900 [Chthoniobacterales bacterium]